MEWGKYAPCDNWTLRFQQHHFWWGTEREWQGRLQKARKVMCEGADREGWERDCTPQLLNCCYTTAEATLLKGQPVMDSSSIIGYPISWNIISICISFATNEFLYKKKVHISGHNLLTTSFPVSSRFDKWYFAHYMKWILYAVLEIAVRKQNRLFIVVFSQLDNKS